MQCLYGSLNDLIQVGGYNNVNNIKDKQQNIANGRWSVLFIDSS